MAWATKEKIENIKELFTSGKISKIEWTYSAGGDSLNDYNAIFYNEKMEEVECGIDVSDYILDNISINENSDGYYQGMSGTVTLLMEDDEIVFQHSYQEEWNEDYAEEITISITPFEKKVLSKIDTLTFTDDEEMEVTFKKNMFLNNKIISSISDIEKKIKKEGQDFLVKKDIYDSCYSYNFESVKKDKALFNLDYTQLTLVDGNE